ncbi:unnamed protein product [Sphenostylis stenocarpa]|uniref:Uncharacterized protein n=1 Tax=Sphenostylis stenocarpa TaxID=92480 RepID=A0AA86RNE4_9FABA|nr:unnamed protein product [Sphenostylis stenocarpa]
MRLGASQQEAIFLRRTDHHFPISSTERESIVIYSAPQQYRVGMNEKRNRLNLRSRINQGKRFEALNYNYRHRAIFRWRRSSFDGNCFLEGVDTVHKVAFGDVLLSNVKGGGGYFTEECYPNSSFIHCINLTNHVEKAH